VWVDAEEPRRFAQRVEERADPSGGSAFHPRIRYDHPGHFEAPDETATETALIRIVDSSGCDRSPTLGAQGPENATSHFTSPVEFVAPGYLLDGGLPAHAL